MVGLCFFSLIPFELILFGILKSLENVEDEVMKAAEYKRAQEEKLEAKKWLSQTEKFL